MRQILTAHCHCSAVPSQFAAYISPNKGRPNKIGHTSLFVCYVWVCVCIIMLWMNLDEIFCIDSL